MQFSEFQSHIVSLVQNNLPEGLQAELRVVEKNNDVTRTGISLKRKGDLFSAPQNRVSPVVYLEHYYARFQDGENLLTLANDIAEILLSPVPDFFVEHILSWDYIRDHLVWKLCNAKKNLNRKQKFYTIPYLDLSILFCIEVIDENVGCGLIHMTEDLVEQLKVPRKDLYDAAMSCMRKNRRVSLRRLGELLDERGLPDVPNSQIYVLTNEQGKYGASVILYSDAMHVLANELKSDLYLLPSSIHELLVIPSVSAKLEDLQTIVLEVNKSEVPEEDYLSDTVYIYKRDEDVITYA